MTLEQLRRWLELDNSSNVSVFLTGWLYRKISWFTENLYECVSGVMGSGVTTSQEKFFVTLYMIKIFQNKILFEKGFISPLFFLFLNEEVGSFSTKLIRWETSSSPVGSQ